MLALNPNVIIFLTLGWFLSDDIKLDKRKYILQILYSYNCAICRAINIMIAFANK